MANDLYIDEYVTISYQLGSNVTIPENHRLFNALMNFESGVTDLKIVFTKDNVKDSLIRAKLTTKALEYLDTFFAQSPATQLTVWNFATLNGTPEEIASVFDTEEKQLIMPKYDDPEALKGDLDKLGLRLKDKYVYVHLTDAEIKTEGYIASLPISGRNLSIMQVEVDQGEWFDVLGNMGSTGNYIKFSLFNNNSTLQQLQNVLTIDTLINNKASGLLYYESLAGKRYENLVDSTGLDINYNFIREDIAYLVQIEVMTLLDGVEIPYIQAGFNVVGNTIYQACVPIINKIPLAIKNLKVFNAIYNNQTSVNKAINKADGYVVKYSVVPQLRSIGVTIYETL